MRVLYVATDLRDADILQQEVRRVSPGLSMEICAGLSELRARPEQSTPDVLLMDCSLSEAEQLQLIHYARVKQLGVPIVGVMGTNVATPSGALTAGLDDLLVRGPKFAERLQPALRLLTERYRTILQTVRENEKLKKSEARLRLIIEALPTGVLLLDQAGKILAMNAAGVTLFGAASPQDVVSRPFSTLIPVEDQPAFQDFLKKTSGGEEASVQFTTSLHDEGEGPRVYSLRGLCIQRDDAGQQALLGVLDRVTAGAPGVAHAWSPDFDLAGLGSPVLDLVGDEEARARAAELEQQAAEAAGRVAGLESQVAATQAKAMELETARRAAEGVSAQLEAEVARLRAANEAAESRASGIAEQLAHAQQQHAALVQERNHLHQTLSAEQEQRAAAEARVQQIASSASDDLAKQAETLAGLAGELESARGELTTLHDRLTQDQRALAQERAAKEQAQALLGQAESRGADVEMAVRHEMASIADQLAQTRGAYDQLQHAHGSLRHEHDGLRAEHDRQRSEYDRQRAEIDQQRAEHDRQRAELDGLRGVHDALQTAHETLQVSASHATSQYEAQRQAWQQSQTGELEAVRGELAASAAALSALREAHEALHASLAQKDAHVAALEQRAQIRIAELEQEHRVVVDRLKELLDQAVKDTQAQAASRGPGADAARRNAERVGRLAAAMAADLKAAAESAMEASRDVLNALPQGAFGRDAAERAMDASHRSVDLARHLARMSTRYMGQVNRIDISYCVRQQEMLLAHLAGPDIDVQFELAQGLTSLELDAQDVTQILTSLMVAARDALPLGGVIEITTSLQRTAPDGARADQQPRPLVLAVTARGYGIRPVSSAPCEEVTVRCNGLLTTVIEPNVSWTLMAMLPGGPAEEAPVTQDLTRSA